MREADGDVELARRLVVELEALPLAVGRRRAAQVDDDVEDPPARAAHELRLAGADREVHPAQHALARARVVVLHERLVDAVLGPDVRAVALEEEAARVAVDGGLEQHEAVEAGVEAAHPGAI